MADDKSAMNISWRSAETDPPGDGRQVELSRDRSAVLDTVFWHPINWNLRGLFWRPLHGRLPFKPGNVMIDYTNHAGVRAVREIVPSFDNPMRWGATEWHPEEQWLLDALDVAKDDLRTFAVANIHGWYPVGDRQASIDASLAKQLQASIERNGRTHLRLMKLAARLMKKHGDVVESLHQILRDEEPTWPIG